jgi:hypothetical protein
MELHQEVYASEALKTKRVCNHNAITFLHPAGLQQDGYRNGAAEKLLMSQLPRTHCSPTADKLDQV